MNNLIIRGIFQAACGVAFMGITLNAVFNGKLNLAPHASSRSLNTFNSKLQFVIEYQTIAVFNIIMSVYYVIFSRISNSATDPMGKNDILTLKHRKILNNTIEQSLLSFLVQITLISNLTTTQLIHIIPLMNFYSLIGRICFLFGYPNHRVFGFSLIFYPSVFASFYSFYKFLNTLKIIKF